MKEKVSIKLKEVRKNLEIAKKYEVDVRMEEKTLMECSILYTKNVYGNNMLGKEDIKSEEERYNSILQDLLMLEQTISDKRKIYQVRETLSGTFRSLKNGNIDNIQETIDNIKMQYGIYCSCRVSEIYRPENVIKEIFGYLYETIKLELWFNNGKSSLLDDVMNDGSNIIRISSFLNKDIFVLEKILGTDNSRIADIKKYRSEIKESNVLIDSELLNMVVDTLVSYDVEDEINLQVKGIQDKLNNDIKKADDKREEYKNLAKMQIKTRKFIRSLRKKIDRRLAPIILSLAIMGGAGFGTYHLINNSMQNDETISMTELDDESKIKQLSTKDKRENSKENNISLSMVTGTGVILSASYVMYQGVGLYKDKKKYNKDIDVIVDRKRQMEDIKKGVGELVNLNNNYIAELNKQRERMIWASLYLGPSEEQNKMLSDISDSLNITSEILSSIDNIEDEPREEDENFCKRLGR